MFKGLLNPANSILPTEPCQSAVQPLEDAQLGMKHFFSWFVRSYSIFSEAFLCLAVSCILQLWLYCFLSCPSLAIRWLLHIFFPEMFSVSQIQKRGGVTRPALPRAKVFLCRSARYSCRTHFYLFFGFIFASDVCPIFWCLDTYDSTELSLASLWISIYPYFSLCFLRAFLMPESTRLLACFILPILFRNSRVVIIILSSHTLLGVSTLFEKNTHTPKSSIYRVDRGPYFTSSFCVFSSSSLPA